MRKPIEAKKMMDEYGIRYMCSEPDVRELEAYVAQLEEKLNCGTCNNRQRSDICFGCSDDMYYESDGTGEQEDNNG